MQKMNSLFKFILIGLFFVSSLAAASPPAPLIGPNSYKKFKGRVTLARPVWLNVGTSDTTAEKKQFIEVRLEVLSSFTFLLEEEVLKKGKRAALAKPKKIATPKNQRISLVYVRSSEKISTGDILEGQTRDRQTISYGWTGEAHLAEYKIIPAKPGK